MKRYFTFFVVVSIFYSNTVSYHETASTFSQIIKEVFQDRIICYVNDRNSFNYLIQTALLNTETSIISISYNFLKDLTTSLCCTGYIVVLSDGNDFIKYHLNKNNSFMFKPWTRLLLMYETPPDFKKLHHFVLNSAIDVLVVEHKLSNYSNLSFSYDGFVVEPGYKNTTILSWHSNQSKIDWTKFRPAKWTPEQVVKSLRVAMFHCPPFMYVNKEGKVVGGIEYHVIKEVIKHIPIETVLITSEAWQLISDSVEQSINDVAACSQWYISSKDKNLDFTYPIRQIMLTFLVKKPRLLPDSTFIFQPLHGLVYVVTLLILILVLFGFALINKVLGNHVHGLILQLLYLVRVLSMGGLENLPVLLRTSTKFLLGFWYFYCVILSTYYSAGMTSCFTNPRYTDDVDTLQKMVDSKIEWYSTDTYLHEYFTSLNISTFNELVKLHVRKHRILDRTATSAIAVKTIAHRYVTDIEELPYEDRKYYKVLADSVGTYHIGFVLQKNSPLTKLFDETIFRLVESGIYQSWVVRVLSQNDKFQSSFFTNYIKDPHMNVNIKRIQGAFYLLLGGYVLSLTSFLVELLLRNTALHRTEIC